MEALYETIRSRLAGDGRLLLAIDGRCGCGKSSLAAQLAAEYQELEATGLATPQVEETKRHIREVVASFGQVYTASFEKLLTDKLLDVDAELKVMEQTLDAEGIERVPEAQTADEASPEEQAQAGEPAAAGAAQAAGEAVPPGGAPSQLRERPLQKCGARKG